MKKIFSLLWGIAILTLTAGSFIFAFTQEQQEAYQWAYKYGLTTQPTIESARMNSPLTRQAFAKMVVNYLENVIWVKQSKSSPCYFPDEGKITSELIPYTKKTCAYKIMWSNGTKFSPTQPIDRAQLWTVFSRILWGDRYNVDGKWYHIYHVNALKDAGIMNNISNLVWVTAKRWDVMIMFKRMYEKFGSNVYLNSWTQIPSNYSVKTGTTTQSSDNREDLDNNYISTTYSNSNVIYTWKDWTKYYYDDKFITMLRSEAEKKWESNLAEYLKIEAEYFKDWLDQLSDLDDEELLESMWINVSDVDPDNMTKQEKEELIKKFKSALGKIIDENKNKNNNFLKDLEKITKNIKNDKFWLKEKYNKTKTFMDSSNSFLDLYSESIFGLMEMALLKEDDDNSDEWMAQAFWLIWVALMYQWVAQEYQTYVEEWGVNAINLLLSESNNSEKSADNSKNSSKSSDKTLNNSESSWIEEIKNNWKWDIIMATDLIDHTKNWRYTIKKELTKRTLFIDEENNYIIKIWPEFIWYTMEVYYNDIEEVGSIDIRTKSNNIWFQVRINPRENCKYINFSYGNEYIWWANDERVFTRYSTYKSDRAELITNVKSWKSVDELEKQHNCKAQWY